MDYEYESPASCDLYEDDEYLSEDDLQQPSGKEFPAEFSDSDDENSALGGHICLRDELIVDLLNKMSNGESVRSNKAVKINLFCDHPAIVLQYLEPCLRDKTEYYLIYTTLPEDSDDPERRIVDSYGGIWEATMTPHAITNKGVRIGKRQQFKYKPCNQDPGDWEMVMYNLDISDNSPYVMCKVYPSLSSETAKAVREAERGEARKIDVWELLATAECKAKTQKEMSKATTDKFLEYLLTLELYAVEKASNLVAIRNGVARKEFRELQQRRKRNN